MAGARVMKSPQFTDQTGLFKYRTPADPWRGGRRPPRPLGRWIRPNGRCRPV